MIVNEDKLAYQNNLRKLRAYIEMQSENEDLKSIDEEEVVSKLMEGKFEELGGVVALRGFMYQYYVTIYYILKMVRDPDKSWWNKVVFEYFDDVALLSDEKIRFIQVKTVRDNSNNKLQPNDLYARTPKKSVNSESEYFNSWIDKLFKNYDLFKSKNDSTEIRNTFLNPEFELVSNTIDKSLDDLTVFTHNSKFSAKVPEDNILYKKLKMPVVVKKQNILFEDIYINPINFYLEKLYINKLGSFDSLKKKIEGLIEDIIGINHSIKRIITDGVFSRLLSEVAQKTYRDDDELDKSDLVFDRKRMSTLINIWSEAIKDETSVYLQDNSLLRIINQLLEELREEYCEKFKTNQKLCNELLESLDWFRSEFEIQFRKDSTHCLLFLNKLFNLENLIKYERFHSGKDIQHIKKSLSYIIRSLVFYPSRKFEFENSQLLFHRGELENENLLFTIYNAREKLDTTIVKNTIISALINCEYSSDLRQDIFSLIVDEKINEEAKQSNTYERLAAKFNVTKVETKKISIIDSPDNLKFVNKKEIDTFFKIFSEVNEENCSTFQNLEMESLWKESLLEK